MIKFTSYKEKLKTIEKKRLIKSGVIILATIAFLITIILFVISFVTEDFDLGLRAMRIGGGIFSGLVGSFMAYGFIVAAISLIKGKQAGQSNSVENETIVTAYTFTNHPAVTNAKTSICDFCGYKNKTDSTECTKCGAPIKV